MIRNYISQPFIIIGMHRSGTTLLANAMNDAGICMGVFRDHNGEAMHFLSLNQQLLWADDANWINPKVPLLKPDLLPTANEMYAEHIKSMSSNATKLRLLHNAPWGWKDPRNTFTLQHWLDIFPKAKVIHVLRDGRDVALSLQARNSVEGEVFDEKLNSLQFNFGLWETYVEEGLRWQERLSGRYFEIRYEDLVKPKGTEMYALDNFTGKKVSSHIRAKPPKNKTYPDELQALAAESRTFNKLAYPL